MGSQLEGTVMMARKAWYQECEEISYIAFIIRKSKKKKKHWCPA